MVMMCFYYGCDCCAAYGLMISWILCVVTIQALYLIHHLHVV